MITVQAVDGGLANVPSTEEQSILTAALTAEFTGRKLHLFQNNHVVTKTTVLSDLTEATFVGYSASAAVTWSSEFEDIAGNVGVLGSRVVFLATAATTPNTIYGWYLADDPATKIVMAGRFPAPIQISNAGDGIAVDLIASLSNITLS